MERHAMVALLVLFFSLIASVAEATDMCNVAEDPVVCALKVERNNAMDDLAVAEGGRQTEIKKREGEATYWKQYTNGLLNEVELRQHIEKVCAWKGQQNEPTGALCQWWDSNYVPHPVNKGLKR